MKRKLRRSTHWILAAASAVLPACALMTDLDALGPPAGSLDGSSPDAMAADGATDAPVTNDGSGDGAPPTTRKRIFFTSGKYLGSALGGIAGADAKCGTAVQARGLGGTFKAWISDSKTDAHDRIVDVSPWYSVDRKTLLFLTKAGLDYVPLNPIVLDDSATPRVSLCYWTGTALGGTRSPVNCGDWGTADAGANGGYGAFGLVGATDQKWTDHSDGTFPCFLGNNSYGQRFCSSAYGVLCIEQ